MAATAVLNTTTHHPTAHLQIKYVSRLPDTRTSSPFLSHARNLNHNHTPSIVAMVLDSAASNTWTITTILPNISSSSQPQSVKIYAWPMFEPESAQFVASGSTHSVIAPVQFGRVEVNVPKRELARFDERRGKWVLEEGIYMFEIRASDDVRAGVSVVKQVSVVGNMVWDQ